MVIANQVIGTCNKTSEHPVSDHSSSLNLFQSFNKDQMEQLRMMLTQHLSSFEGQNNVSNDPKNVHITGTCLSTMLLLSLVLSHVGSLIPGPSDTFDQMHP